MPFASTSVTLDPVWPWSVPGAGLLALLAAGGLIVALTVATYLVSRRGKPGRMWAVLALRLAALLVVALLLLRPSFAQEDDSVLPTRLIVLVDASRSMAVNDELNGQSRWDRARALLRHPG